MIQSKRNLYGEYIHTTDDLGPAMNIRVESGYTFRDLKIPKGDKPNPPYKWDLSYLNSFINHVENCQSLSEIRIPRFRKYKGLRTEILKFILTLDFYDRKIKNQFMTSREILLRCLKEGPSFAKVLSDLWKYSQRKTFSSDWEKLISEDAPMLIESIDEIFDPKCLIRWDIPDEKDYLLLLEPSPKIDDFLIQTVTDELNEFLDGFFKIPKRDLIDDLTFFRGSKVFTDIENLKTDVCYRIKNVITDLDYTDKLVFLRRLIWKSPDEQRDALICDVNTLHTLNEVSRIISYICKDMEEYKIGGRFDPWSAMSSIKGLNTYMMVDLKKSGLTFPRELVLTVLKVLKERIPSRALDLAYEGYKTNPLLYVDDGNLPKAMTSGLGLGMLNELVTLVMCLIFRIKKKEDFFPNDTKGWFIGDDQLIYWPKGNSLKTEKELIEGWEQTLKDYGFQVHGKKPLIGRYPQFCDHWCKTKLNTEKRVRQYNILLSFLDGCNIHHAKILFSNVFKKYWGLSAEDNEYALDLAQSYWGSESDPDIERFLPIECGGWTQIIRDGLNDFLNMCSEGLIPTNYQQILLVKPKGLDEFCKLKSKFSKRNDFKWVFDTNEEYTSIFSIKNQIKGMTDRWEIFTHKWMNYRRWQERIDDYYDYVLDLRSKALKKYTKVDLLKYIDKEDFNNVRIPSCSLLQGLKELRILTTPDCNITKCDDTRRLWLTLFSSHQVRPPSYGDPTSLLQEFISNDELQEIKRNPLEFFFLIRNWKKIFKYGNKVKVILEDLHYRFDLSTIYINSKETKEHDYIDAYCYDISTSSKTQIIPIDGILIKDDEYYNPIRTKSWLDFNIQYREYLGIKLQKKFRPNDEIPDGLSFFNDLVEKSKECFSEIFSYKATYFPVNSREFKEEETLKKTFVNLSEEDTEIDINYFNYQIQGALQQMSLSLAQPDARIKYMEEEMNLDYGPGSLEFSEEATDALLDMFGD
jgi:hypothetical protein